MTKQLIKQCRVCNSPFTKPVHLGYKSWEKRETCSKSCGATHKGADGTYRLTVKICKNKLCLQPFTKSKKDTHEHFNNQKYCSISCGKVGKQIGENNIKWKGDSVGYFALHAWIQRQYGKPQFCEHCKTSERRMYHWANVSKEYKRDRDDWLRLCVPCHRKFDK